MADKITTTFGADTAELEGGMIRSVRYVEQLNKSIGNLGKAKGPEDLTASLARSNEQLAKGMNILRGGAVGAGVGALLGQMKSFASYAKELGDNATEAQKSAAKWGEEFSKVGDAIKGAGASVLGTLASWGRSIGDSFRDPLDKEYDAVAESSEKMAERQEASLAKAKVAHAKAAEEIPALLKTLREAQDATANVGRDDQAILYENQIALEKKLDATSKIADLTVRQAERLKIEIELEKNRAKIKALEAEHQKQRDKEQAERDKKLADDKAKLEADAQKKITAAEKPAKVEKEKSKKDEVLAPVDALAVDGRTRNEKGQLTRRGVVISEEDARRADKTKAENKDMEKNFGKEPEKYLSEIVKLLTPRGK